MLHLEWDHFRDNLIRSIENFKETDFSDVILACQDGQVGEKMCCLFLFSVGDVT